MAARKKTDKPAIAPKRAENITSDAQSGTNWASLVDYGPACICGAGQRTLDAATALKGVHADPKGTCARHPGGTVQASLPEVWEKVRNGNA